MNQGQKRTAEIKRETKETRIEARINLDGAGATDIETPYGFFNHMLTAMFKHALIDLELSAEGDVEVDAHHTVEDVGIVLGQAIGQAVGDKKGIARFASVATPMDEALALATLDISGRPYLVYDVVIPLNKQWEFDCNLAHEFFQAFASAARITLHLSLEYGDNYHHCLEAIFKSAGRALGKALEPDPRVTGVPSSKGTL